jgi:predicted DNA-binding transcriptional regulator YafY
VDNDGPTAKVFFMITATGPVARFAYERALEIDRALRASSHVSKRDLAAKLEVAPRTIQRDLEFMRDRLKRPLAYDAALRAYRYTETVAPLGEVHFSEADLRTLITTKATPMPAANTGGAILATIAASLPQSAAERLANLESAFYFKPFGEAAIKPEVFDILLSAVLERAEIRFGYDKLSRSAPETRVVQPLTLCLIDGMWYLLGRDRVREGHRTFALPRISNLQRTGRNFRRPPRFSAETHLAASFGLITGEMPKRVSIRFDAFASRLVRERSWHSTQTFTPLPLGACRMELWVGRFEEIERWILSWGEHAFVERPKELVARVRDASRAIARKYDNTTPSKHPTFPQAIPVPIP